MWLVVKTISMVILWCMKAGGKEGHGPSGKSTGFGFVRPKL